MCRLDGIMVAFIRRLVVYLAVSIILHVHHLDGFDTAKGGIRDVRE